MMSARTAGRILAKTWSCGVWSWLHHPKTARQFWRRVARSILNEPGKSFEGLRLPSVELTDLLGQPDQIPVSLHNYCYQHGDMPLHEMVMLCRLVRVRQPRVIFEIGTFHGGTTLQMAANSAAQIYTLDLPPEAPKPVWDATLDVYPGGRACGSLTRRMRRGSPSFGAIHGRLITGRTTVGAMWCLWMPAIVTNL